MAEIHEDYDEPCVCIAGYASAVLLYGRNREEYQVTPRTSSVEALEAFRAKPDEFDLVITDMTMPNMTGLELAPRLREIRPDIPIIICTGFSIICIGFSGMTDGDKAKSMGILGYVMKPITKEEIARSIRQVLDEEK